LQKFLLGGEAADEPGRVLLACAWSPRRAGPQAKDELGIEIMAVRATIAIAFIASSYNRS